MEKEYDNFRDWFWSELGDYAEDIASHGADAGYPHITYTSNCCKIFDQFADEIWEMAVNDAEDYGNKNVAEMVAGFKRDDMLGSWDQFRNLMLWYACEKVAANESRPESEEEDED